MAEAAAAAPRPVVLIQVEDLVASGFQGQIAAKALDYGNTLCLKSRCEMWPLKADPAWMNAQTSFTYVRTYVRTYVKLVLN